MKWIKPPADYDKAIGRREPAPDNCMISSEGEGYTIACVRTRGMPGVMLASDRYAYTLSWRKEVLLVIRDIKDVREEKQKAFANAKAYAVHHWSEEAQATRSPSPQPSAP